MNAIIERLQQCRLFSDLDLHFARLMLRMDGGDNEPLALAAALTSRSVQQGDICLDLKAHAGTLLGGEAGGALPELESWLASLRASPVVGEPGDYTPLVLDHAHRLYLYRYWDYEQRLGGALISRAGMEPLEVDERRLRQGLDRLFAQNRAEGADWQKIAAATALLRRLTVISGGPGTGKTTTVVRLLALLVDQRQPAPAIALAAPTGKAAARLEESIRRAKQHLDVPGEQLAAIPERAQTLHRLLGGGANTVRFRHNSDTPLPIDVLVLDEASMVDLALMSKLMQALPEHARLILLGDRNQLASVEAGSVLGDICAADSRFSNAFAARVEAITGERLESGQGQVGPLSDSIVLLRQSYRFDHRSGIGQLASAVIAGDSARVNQLFAAGQFSDIALYGPAIDPVQQAAEALLPYCAVVNSDAGVAEVFTAFDRFRVLCATRLGARGVERLNREIEQALTERGGIDARQPWYCGRPVMITRNDYNLHLYNGDIGIALKAPDGQLKVWFMGADGQGRAFPASRLPEHETVYAMTVHKSQGSEFDRVMLVLPEDDMPLLSRELIYTGITRARGHIAIATAPELLAAAISRRIDRKSGLKERLWPFRSE